MDGTFTRPFTEAKIDKTMKTKVVQGKGRNRNTATQEKGREDKKIVSEVEEEQTHLR